MKKPKYNWDRWLKGGYTNIYHNTLYLLQCYFIGLLKNVYRQTYILLTEKS